MFLCVCVSVVGITINTYVYIVTFIHTRHDKTVETDRLSPWLCYSVWSKQSKAATQIERGGYVPNDGEIIADWCRSHNVHSMTIKTESVCFFFFAKALTRFYLLR